MKRQIKQDFTYGTVQLTLEVTDPALTGILVDGLLGTWSEVVHTMVIPQVNTLATGQSSDEKIKVRGEQELTIDDTVVKVTLRLTCTAPVSKSDLAKIVSEALAKAHVTFDKIEAYKLYLEMVKDSIRNFLFYLRFFSMYANPSARYTGDSSSSMADIQYARPYNRRP